MKLLIAVIIALVLAVGGPTVAATLVSDNFDDGNADGWAATDPGLWSVVDNQYFCDNYGGGRTFSARPDISLATDWVFSADVAPIRQGTGEPKKYSGLAIVADPSNPWANFVTVSLVLHEDLDHVGIQIHWGSGANDTWTTGWTDGAVVHMTVERAAGSDTLSTSISSDNFSATLSSPALTSKLGTCVVPALYGYNDSYTNFDNVLITSSQAVPEPGSLVALASGLAACLFGLRRRG